MSGEQAFAEALRNRGVLDAIKTGDPSLIDRPPADEVDTGGQPRDPDSGQFVAAEPEEQVVDETTPAEETEEVKPEETEETVEAEGELEDFVLELDPDHPFFLKYGGDPDKALKALEESQSVIGRQGNDLGDMKAELAALREQLAKAPQMLGPYRTDWPDEDAEPEEAIPQFRGLAEEALSRQDQGTFLEAMAAWHELDPVGAETYATLKVVQAQLSGVQSETAPIQSTVDEEVAKTIEKYPDITKPEIKEAMDLEARNWPALQASFQHGTPQEQAQALEFLYQQVASRKSSETSQRAIKRVVVKQSEEAREARARAKVVSGQRAAGEAVEPESEVDAWREQFREKVTKNRVSISDEISRAYKDATGQKSQ